MFWLRCATSLARGLGRVYGRQEVLLLDALSVSTVVIPSHLQHEIREMASNTKITREWYPPAADGAHTGPLLLYNSFVDEKVPFVPETGPNSRQISWYACGPTVYDVAHMGHARNYLSFDIVRRVLEDYFGYNCLMVMNVTDVDDKIILRARRNYLLAQYKGSGKTPDQVNTSRPSTLDGHDNGHKHGKMETKWDCGEVSPSIRPNPRRRGDEPHLPTMNILQELSNGVFCIYLATQIAFPMIAAAQQHAVSRYCARLKDSTPSTPMRPRPHARAHTDTVFVCTSNCLKRRFESLPIRAGEGVRRGRHPGRHRQAAGQGSRAAGAGHQSGGRGAGRSLGVTAAS